MDYDPGSKTSNIEFLKKILDWDGGKTGFEGYRMKMILRYRLLYNNPHAWEALAYDAAINAYNNSHVTYFEIRTSVDKPPLTLESILRSLHKGLIRAEKDCPGLKTGIIVSLDKSASLEEAQRIINDLIQMRRKPEYRQHIVALDTAGQEILKDSRGNPVNFDPVAFTGSF